LLRSLPLDSGLGFGGLFQIIVFGVALPIVAWRGRHGLEVLGDRPRGQLYVGVILQQVVLAGVSLVVANRLGLVLFPKVWPSPAHVGLVLGLVALLALVLLPYWRGKVARGDRIVETLAPRSGAERALWAGVSVTAGIGEEITYRGVLFSILLRLTEHPVVAVVATTLAFGSAHVMQGRTATLIVTAIGLGLQIMAVTTGSLYLAMITHIAYDLTAGWVLSALVRRRPSAQIPS
jgi:membrane protease YdiL (CAAX protease family)